MTPQIGFIGLGIMGKPMARNLHKAGFPVMIWNRSRQPMDELAGEGLKPADSIPTLAQRCTVVITMLPDSADVADVVNGATGLLQYMSPGSLLIDMSTILPETARQLAAAAHERGVTMLDAPVSGGDKGAIAATLSIMVGGDRTAFERALPIFQAMGKTITYCGSSGAGQIVKACNQIAVALNIAGVAEALALGQAAGIDPDIILRVLGGGLAQSKVLELRGPTMAQKTFVPGFRARLHLKDMNIIQATALTYHLQLPFSSLAQKHFQMLVERGYGDLDHSALALTVGHVDE
ncbi:NAD(P)-dependent oxidoreductase [Chloroflexus sp. Y-396-1]|uniref:NAD(P)-dependent oxidoreductase n=1 Tax=Chloroflexus sp. Y-396-1 TaxID=867845 RepID=UPI00048DC2EA|nr:NAD(P)-dependent oxidoreductase [Chloroflexus sp. Y-396-1]